MHRFLGMFLLLAVASGANAQEETPGLAAPESELLSAAKQKFAEKIQVLRGKYAADQTGAKNDLLAKYDDLIKIEKTKGRLQQLLDLQKNREQLAANQPVTGTLQPGETAAHALYDTKLKAALTTYEKTAKLVTNEFLANLDAGIREKTKADRIDEAVEIRKAREHYAALGIPPAVAGTAKPAESESATAPAIPGTIPGTTPGTAANPFANRAEGFKAAEGESLFDPPKADPAPRVASTIPKTTTTTPAPAKQPAVKIPANSDWAKVMAKPATITVAGQEPIALDPELENQPFKEIPGVLAKRATIYHKQKDRYNGVCAITVDKEGFLLLACDYNPNGNNSNGWQQERWMPERFEKEGWKKLSAQDLGGSLGELTIFLKYVKAGEEVKVRTSKYSAPKAIIFDAPASK